MSNDYLDPLRETALGVISAKSFPAIIDTVDAMLKSSSVRLVGYEKIGSGHVSAIIRGKIAEVRLAIQTGTEVAKQSGQSVSTTVLPRPHTNLEKVFPFTSKLLNITNIDDHHTHSSQALGFLETRGFPALVGAADAMLKSANVQLIGYETIGDGLCTIIIQGSVTNVAVAVESGISESLRRGWDLNAVTVIPRPLDDMVKTLPGVLAEPLLIPIAVKEMEKQLVQLPDLAQLGTPVEVVKTITLPEPLKEPLKINQPEELL